jgi:hypothetical protein
MDAIDAVDDIEWTTCGAVRLDEDSVRALEYRPQA